MTTETLLRLPSVMEMTGLSKSTLYDLQRAGTFPRARKLSRRCVAWRSREVQDWIASRDLAKE